MEHSVIGKSVACGVIVLFLGMSITPVGSSLSFDNQTLPSGSIPTSDSVKTISPIDVNLTVSGTHGNNGWYISPVTLFFTSDNGTPVVFFRFFNTSWILLTDGPIVVTQQGNITFQWYWVDWNGTVSPIHTLWFHIDYTPPVVHVSKERIGWRKWKISATAYDNISGLDRCEIYIGPYLQYTYLFTDPSGEQSVCWILSPIPHATFNFTFKVFDLAGNSGSGSVSKSCSQSLTTIQLLRDSILNNRKGGTKT